MQIWKWLALVAVALAAGCQPVIDHPDTPTTQAVELAFEPHIVVDADNKTLLRYRILKPRAIEPGRAYPLIVVLHGAGERGDDNFKQLTHGARELMRYTRSQPAFVIFPQCPRGTWWDGPNRLRAETQPADVVAPMPRVIELVDRIMREQPIDRSRVYITGMSMGGYGTFTMVAARPDLFAAAMPVCGGGNPQWSGRYRSTAFWVTHGRADPWVSVEESRDMVRAMQASGVYVRYTEFAGAGHDAWTPTYNSNGVLNWLFAQRRSG